MVLSVRAVYGEDVQVGVAETIGPFDRRSLKSEPSGERDDVGVGDALWQKQNERVGLAVKFDA